MQWHELCRIIHVLPANGVRTAGRKELVDNPDIDQPFERELYKSHFSTGATKSNLMAVWRLFLLELHFSAGVFQFKYDPSQNVSCSTFGASFSGCFDGCSFPTFVHFAATDCKGSFSRNIQKSERLCDNLRSAATRCKSTKNRLKIRRASARGGSTPPPGTKQNKQLILDWPLRNPRGQNRLVAVDSDLGVPCTKNSEEEGLLNAHRQLGAEVGEPECLRPTIINWIGYGVSPFPLEASGLETTQSCKWRNRFVATVPQHILRFESGADDSAFASGVEAVLVRVKHVPLHQ